MALDRVERCVIEGKIDVIERNLDFLHEYKSVSEEDFLKSYKDIQAVKYSLLETIEACLDIAAHIISSLGLERAESYSEMFEILGKRGIIDQELASKLADMARFRNLLVHGYTKIENLKVLEIVKSEVDDVRDYIRQVLSKV